MLPKAPRIRSRIISGLGPAGFWVSADGILRAVLQNPFSSNRTKTSPVDHLNSPIFNLSILFSFHQPLPSVLWSSITCRNHEQRSTKEGVRHGRVSFDSNFLILRPFHRELHASNHHDHVFWSVNGPQLCSANGVHMICLLDLRAVDFTVVPWCRDENFFCLRCILRTSSWPSFTVLHSLLISWVRLPLPIPPRRSLPSTALVVDRSRMDMDM